MGHDIADKTDRLIGAHGESVGNGTGDECLRLEVLASTRAAMRIERGRHVNGTGGVVAAVCDKLTSGRLIGTNAPPAARRYCGEGSDRLHGYDRGLALSCRRSG